MIYRGDRVKVLSGKYVNCVGVVQAVEPFEFEVDVRIPRGSKNFILRTVMLKESQLRKLEPKPERIYETQ